MNPRGWGTLVFIQQFLLDFWNMQLWFALNAVILLIASELLESLPAKKFMINKKRLSTIALLMGLIFMVTVFWRAYQIWTRLQP